MMRYWPEPSVMAVRTFSMSTGLAASTVTPGRTAPDASATVPASVAWACAIAGSASTHAAESTNARHDAWTNGANRSINYLLIPARQRGGDGGAHVFRCERSRQCPAREGTC